jgi:OOP family OmpA-OmpF porin
MVKNMSKPAGLLSAFAIALSAFATNATAQGAPSGYVNDARGGVIKSPFNLCYRTGYWSPGMANSECDPDLVPRPAAVPAPAPRPAPPAAAPAPAPAPVAPAPVPVPVPAPVQEKVTLSADTLFDFDKAVVKPDARSRLDQLVGQLRDINLEVVIAVGHTDSIGSDAYNQKLSQRRAEAVKAYLVSKGVPANRVYTEGKGEKQPIADNKSAEGRSKNRRVDVEVVGTRSAQKK